MVTDLDDDRAYLFAEVQYQIDVILDLLRDRQIWRDMTSVSLELLRERTLEVARLRREFAALRRGGRPFA